MQHRYSDTRSVAAWAWRSDYVDHESFVSGKLPLIALVVSTSTLMAQAPPATFARYRLPSPGFGIATGPDGALWFTAYSTQRIGRITTAGVIAEYGTSRDPYSIVAGPDGALWFTEDRPSGIERRANGRHLVAGLWRSPPTHHRRRESLPLAISPVKRRSMKMGSHRRS